MRPNNWSRIYLITVLALAVAGCERSVTSSIQNKPSTEGSPTKSSQLSAGVIGQPTIQITKLSPPISRVLRVGEQIAVEVDAAYSLTAESGVVGLVVQAATGASIVHNTEVVDSGLGKVTLKAEFTVPETRAIHVFVPLSAQGQSATSIVDTRAYKVADK